MKRAEIEFTRYGCIVPVPDGPIRILQLTDIQVIDFSQQRYAGRSLQTALRRTYKIPSVIMKQKTWTKLKYTWNHMSQSNTCQE